MPAPNSQLCAVALIIGLLPCGLAAQTHTVSDLMRALASTESSRATFVETKYSALLKAPLVLRGTLSYRRPDSLEKHVLHPYDERIVLVGNTLTIEKRTQARKVTATVVSSPSTMAMVEGMRAVRAGDLAALERHFEVRVDGTRERWTMNLKPIGEETARYVSAVVVSGEEGRISQVAVEEASGDRAVMDIREEPR